MFEAKVAAVLNQQLGAYVLGLDAEALKIGVWSGQIVLENLQLRPEALNALKLPITVTAGLLGKLTLKVPWKRLGREPVVVHIDRVFLVAAPSEDMGEVDPAKAAAAKEEKKRKAVDDGEKAWLEKLASVSGAEKDAKGDEGFFKAYLETVLGNLQLSITNVHVRFEGELPEAGPGGSAARFAAGITLHELSAITTDATGAEAFEAKGLAARLHKRATLKRLAIYYDPSAKPLLPDASIWRSLTPDQWAALFLPGVSDAPHAPAAVSLGPIGPAAAAAAAAVAQRQYLLAPVGGSTAYQRRGRTEGPPGPGDAAQLVALKLDTLAGRLSREQVMHFQRMGAALSAALRRAPNAHLRPRVPVKAEPRAWWHYAVAATADAARAAGTMHLRWDRLLAVALARRRYVTLYKAHIAAAAKKAGRRAGPGVPPGRCDNAEVQELERSLEPGVLLLFRVLAHREVAAEAAASKGKVLTPARQASGPATPEAAAAAAPKPASRMARFFSAYRGTTPAAGAEATTSPASGGAADSSTAADATGMSADDWAKLGEAFELTDAKLSAAAGAPAVPLHPDAMSLRATLAVELGSVQLVGGDAAAPPLLRSALAGLSAELQQFSGPRLRASMGVASLAADAAGVALLRTATSIADAAHPDAPPVLALEYEKAPLDGHADTVVSLATAPVHVTADLVAVRGLVSFFAKPPDLDTAVLAQTMNDTVSDAAAAAAAAAEDSLKALQGRALKMDLRLAVAAPKILVPTPRGAGLLLDLGFLQLASEPPPRGAPRGTECFSLGLHDVSATFVDQHWDWSRLGEASSSSSGHTAADMQPLLSPTGLEATLVRSAAPGPGRPALALSVNVHELAAEVSPSGLTRLFAVIAALSPLWTRPGAPWADAQHEAPLWVLTRNGTTPGRLVWARRWGVLAGEYLYLLESRDTPANAKVAFVSLRHGMEAAPLPARAAAGQAGVLAVLPHGVKPWQAPSSSRATLLRGDDAASAAIWLAQLRGVRKRRHAAAARRRAAGGALVAPPGAAALAAQLDGLEHLIADDDDDGPDAFADASAAEAADSSEASADGEDALDVDRFSDAASSIDEEDSDQDATSDSGSESGAAASAADAATIESFVLSARLDMLTVSLAGSAPPGSSLAERGVVTLHMSGAAVRYGYRMHDMSLGVRLHSLVIDDRLAPAPPPGTPPPYLLTSEAAAVADSFPHYMHRTSTAVSGVLDAALAASGDATAADAAQDATALVRISYRVWADSSPDYVGVACDITARLAAVALALRRPTVAALAALPYDYASKPQTPAPDAHAAGKPSPETNVVAADDSTAAVAATAAAIVAWAAGEGPEEQPAPAGLGGAARVVMRIDVAMESALTQLLLEDGVELSAASMEHLSAVLTLRQATLEVNTSLGNVRLRDGRSPEGHPYRWILDLRQHHGQPDAPTSSMAAKDAAASGSLIVLAFATHVKNEQADGADMSLTASVSAVRLVYLNRFVLELLGYINGLTTAMRRPAAAAATQVAATVVATAAATAPPPSEGKAMRLSVDVAAPLLVLPRTSASAERADMDLGALRYRAYPLPTPCGGVQERSTVELEGMCIAAFSAGGAAPLLQRVDGVRLVMRRPLRGAPLTTDPAVDMDVDVPAISVAMSMTEYIFICAVFSDNFREAPSLPPPVFGAAESGADAPAAPDGAAGVAPQADAVVAHAAAAAAQVATAAAAAAATQASAAVSSMDAKAEQLRFRLALQLHDVRCMLYDGSGRARPLAEARLVAGWASISTSVGGVTRVATAVHDLTVADARVTTPADRRAILGVDAAISANNPSAVLRSASGPVPAAGAAAAAAGGGPKPVLLVVDYSSSVADGTRIGVRLQRPSLAVDVGFLLAVGRFFVPSLAGGTAEAADAVLPRDLVLSPGGLSAAFTADADVALGPRRRLLADAPCDGAEPSYVFDGGGKALILPPAPERRAGAPPSAVVLVGAGRKLTLRNARLLRAERLEEAVQLAPGAQLIIDPSIKLVYGGEDEDRPSGANQPGSPETARLAVASSAGAVGAAKPAAAAAAAGPPVKYAMSVEVDIVGLQLSFVEMLKQGDNDAGGEAAAAAAAAARAKSGAAGWLRTRVGAAMQYRSDAAGAMMGAQLHGLLIEAHLPGAAAPLPLLAPTDAAVTYTAAPGGEARVGVTTSAVDLRLSPRLLGLVSRLAAGAAAVFSHAPTRVSTSFQLLWTAPPPPPPRGASAPGFMPADAADAVQRLCLWRPVPPPGYAPLGDAATAGTAPPAAAALVMRDSGALCLPPLGFARRLALPGGVTLWEPLPPPGCVAAGCVAAEGDTPPPVSAVRCPRAALVVEALPLECMHTDDAGAVWRIGNAAGTVVFALGAGAPRPDASVLWDLREPLGVDEADTTAPPVAPAAPAAAAAPAESSAAPATPVWGRARTKPPCAAVTVVEFSRIWWNYNVTQKSELSLWRPLAPPGFYPVGDCACHGFKPPQRVLVVRDDGDGALAAPTSYVQVFRDTGSRSRKPECREGTLALWRPVPPPGYVALGCVATPNHRTPGADAMRCVRRDLVAETPSPSVCVWTTAGGERKLGAQRASVWALDKRTHAFWACEPPPGAPPGAPPGQRSELAEFDFYELSPPDGSSRGGSGGALAMGASAAAGGGGTEVSVSLGDVGALFFYVASSGRPLPLLDLTLRRCRAHLFSRTGGTALEVKGELGAEVYNSRADAWEPVVEPWPLSVEYESRGGGGGCQGWRPAGAAVRVESRGELRCVVSHALADTLLSYAADAKLHAGEGGEAPPGHAGARAAPLCNALGAQLFVRAGAGGRVTALSPGDALPVPLPAPAALSRHALAQSEPRRTVVVDVLAARRDPSHAHGAAATSPSPSPPSGAAVFVKVTVRSRAVRAFVEARTAPAVLRSDGSVAWEEQVLLEVPAPRGADGSADAELLVSLSLCDAAAAAPPLPPTGLTPVKHGAGGVVAGAAAAKALAAAAATPPLGNVTLRGQSASLPPAWLDLGGGMVVRAAFRVVEAATTFSDPFAPDAGALAGDDASASPLLRSASNVAALAARSLEFTTVIEFEPIWDTSDTGATRVASVWRPILPPGCLSLGDCMLPGAAPPRGVLVLRDDGGDASAPPTRFDSVFHDSGPGVAAKGTNGGPGGSLGVWRPVPPPGYVALGCVVTRDHGAPPLSAVRCLRAELAQRADVPPLPTWESTGAAARLGPLQLSCWRLDDRTGAFWAEPDLRRTTLLAAPLWRLPDEAAHTVDLQRSRSSASNLNALASGAATAAAAAVPDPHSRVEVALRPEGPWGRLWRTGGAAAEGVTAVSLGEAGFALVDRAGAASAARLRAPAELRNNCGVPIQVRLRPCVAPPEASVVVEEVFENERLIPIRGWGTPPLSAMGKFKGRFSARSGGKNSDEFPQREAPPGWQWMGPWQLDASWLPTDRRAKIEAAMPGWDKKAWFHAATFVGHTFPPAPGSEWPGVCTTRRRRWIRTRVRKDAVGGAVAGVGADASLAAATAGAAAAAAAATWTAQSLGVLAPGEALPLPWGCTRDYPPYELQIRPLHVPAAHAEDGAPLPATEPATRWSTVVPADSSVPSAVAALGALAADAAELVACAPAELVRSAVASQADDDDEEESGRHVARSHAAAAALARVPPGANPAAFWFALTASGAPVRAGAGVEVTDWQLAVAAPLTLENLTSAPARYVVWEGDAGAPPAALRLAQSGTLPSGGSVPVHGTDPRKATFLSWAVPAEGFEAASVAPALLFLPALADAAAAAAAAATAAAAPAAALRLKRPSDGALLELRVERDASGGGAGAGGAAVRTARVSAAFLLVNRTRLPIGYWVVAVPPEESDAKADGTADDDKDKATTSVALLEVSTELPAPKDGSATRFPLEVRLSAGTQGMLAPPGVGADEACLRLRVSGSGPSPPIRLGGGVPTAVNAVLPDKRLVQVLVTCEPAPGRFARTVLVTVDHRITLSNRTGEPVSVKQFGIPEKQMPGRSQWAQPLLLHAGDAGVPLIWDDYLKTPAMEFGLHGARWSRELLVTQGEWHMVLHVREDAAAAAQPRPPGDPPPPRVVHVSAEQAATGRIHIALRSACASPPVRIENATGMALAARPAATLQGGSPWVLLPPHTNAPQPWQCSWPGGVTAAIELRCPKKQNETVVTGTETALRVPLGEETVPNADAWASRGLSIVLPDGRRAAVRVRSEGAVRIVTVAVDEQRAAGDGRAPGARGAAAAATEFDISVRILELKASLVDHTPSELLLISADRLSYTNATGLACGRASLMDVRVAALQVDDQSPGTSFPVLLWHSTTDQSDALLRFAMTETTQADAAGEKSHPYVALELTSSPLHLRIHEPLIWRLLAFSDRLRLSRASADGAAAAADSSSAGRGAPAAGARPAASNTGGGGVLSVDPIVTIGSLSLSGAAMRITFKGEPGSRPVGGVSLGLLAFANLDQAPIGIAPMTHEALRMRQGAITPMLLRNITRQLTLQSMRLLTGVDILADASDTLSQISGSIASITGDKHWQERSSSRRMVEETSMAGALVHGGEAMAAGLFRGITGVVTKPVEGARDKGLSGFFTGIGKGVAGLVLQPVSGAVDLASKAVEGVNASKSTVVDFVREGGSGARRRPPLAIGAAGIIRRYDRKAAEGQVILRQAEWRAVGSAGGVVDRLDLFKTRSKFGKDTYEWHEELPDGRIALVTNVRVLMLERHSPNSDLLTERCSIAWAVDLTEILSVELVAAPAGAGGAASSSALAALPSSVVIQLRSKTKDRMLSGVVSARVVACAPGTEQAVRLHAAIHDGLLDLSTRVGLARHSAGAASQSPAGA